MDPLGKIPVQVSLFPEQVQELQNIADRWQVSVEDVIRQSVGMFLLGFDLPEDSVPAELREDDPLLGIIGMFNSGVGDLAENHDKYLMDAEEAHNHYWLPKSS